jgi:hypothetical protein
MAGGIQPGTTATSTKSVLSERRHVDYVSKAFSQRGPHWRIKKSITIEEILGHQGDYSRQKNGKSQRWDADGGFVFYKNKLVGVCENKWQSSPKNACERVCKYLTFLKGKQMFVSCEGPGFAKIDGGGSTGPLIDMLRFAGATVLENVVDPMEYMSELNKWIDSLVVEL